MSEFDVAYRRFGVWKFNFSSANFAQQFGTDPSLVEVPMEQVVERFVNANNKYRPYREKLLKRWRDQLAADGLALESVQMSADPWSG